MMGEILGVSMSNAKSIELFDTFEGVYSTMINSIAILKDDLKCLGNVKGIYTVMFFCVNSTEIAIKKIFKVFPNLFPILGKYDFENVTYNGYRTLVKIMLNFCEEFLKIIKKCHPSLKSTSLNIEELKLIDCSNILLRLSMIIFALLPVVNAKEVPCLLAKQSFNEVFIKITETANFKCCFGLETGFYYPFDVQQAVQQESISKLYIARRLISQSTKRPWYKPTKSKNKLKFGLNEVSANQFSVLYSVATANFYKYHMKKVFQLSQKHPIFEELSYPKVAISGLQEHSFVLEANKTCKDALTKFDIDVPSDATNLSYFVCSSVRREGMEQVGTGICKLASKATEKPSNHIIFHVHGGCSIYNNPKIQEKILRKWTLETKLPIVSVCLQFEPAFSMKIIQRQMYLAYRCLLKSPQKFGANPDDYKIIMVGDSNGANLLLSLFDILVHCGDTLPSGMLLAYPFVNMNVRLSPSRLLALLDPILNINRYLHSSAGFIGIEDGAGIELESNISYETTEDILFYLSRPEYQEDQHMWDIFENTIADKKGNLLIYPNGHRCKLMKLLVSRPEITDPLCSPYYADKETLSKMPPIVFMIGEFDPLLDDIVEYCKELKLHEAKFVKLIVLDGIPHDFINLSKKSKNCEEAAMQFIGELETFISTQNDLVQSNIDGKNQTDNPADNKN